jgi:RNA polymerase sigma factor (sigma-70 family)
VGLDAIDERAGRIVELKFFGGMTHEQIAGLLGVSRSTVEEDWRFARAWLGQKLSS